jgi:chromate reductase, NAD(P)H dehydrogenase (quinone)
MIGPRILAFSGSARSASFNQRLVEYAAGNAVDLGAEVTVINLRDFPMPLMNQDLEREKGVPTEALRLKSLLAEHDGILLSAPEYNSSITPLLKNSLDWVSRRVADEAPMIAFRGKTAALLSASPGRLGGLRGLVHVRAVLNNLGVLVLPGQVSIASAGTAFDETGGLANDADRKRVAALVSELLDMLRRLSPGSN